MSRCSPVQHVKPLWVHTSYVGFKALMVWPASVTRSCAVSKHSSLQKRLKCTRHWRHSCMAVCRLHREHIGTGMGESSHPTSIAIGGDRDLDAADISLVGETLFIDLSASTAFTATACCRAASAASAAGCCRAASAASSTGCCRATSAASSTGCCRATSAASAAGCCRIASAASAAGCCRGTSAAAALGRTGDFDLDADLDKCLFSFFSFRSFLRLFFSFRSFLPSAHTRLHSSCNKRGRRAEFGVPRLRERERLSRRSSLHERERLSRRLPVVCGQSVNLCHTHLVSAASVEEELSVTVYTQSVTQTLSHSVSLALFVTPLCRMHSISYSLTQSVTQ